MLEARDFHLMEYAPQKKDSRIAHNAPVIIECELEHEDSLYSLRKAYELAEVFPAGIEVVEGVCRNNLRRCLAEKRVFAIPNYARQGEFTAMAAVNGRAKGITQIGGVYTHPQFRSRGYAKALITHLADRAHHEERECVLFVRKNNAPAIHSYERAGFVKTGQYAITYYRPRSN
jgi:ribosomal protein S18 acetylase RimI-like enzyme